MSSAYEEFLRENSLKKPHMRNITIGFSGLDPETSLDDVNNTLDNINDKLNNTGIIKTFEEQLFEYFNSHNLILDCACVS